MYLFRSAVLTIATLIANIAIAGGPELFVLRSAGTEKAGIVKIDPATGAEAPFASFGYGRIRLTAVPGRVIAQSWAFHEFDSATGQLLRRYAALAGEQGSWSFFGAAINERMAATMGLEPGFYGFAACPPAGEGNSCVSTPTFPGQTAKQPLDHILLRRGFDPADASVELVRTFAPVDGDVSFSSRLMAADPLRQQLLFWMHGSALDGNISVHRLTRAPATFGHVHDESTLYEERRNVTGRAPSDVYGAVDLATDHHAPGGGLFQLLYYPHLYESRLVRRTLDGSATELLRVTTAEHMRAIATMPPFDADETYTQMIAGIGDTPGAHGTYWRSDLWLFNPADEPTVVTLRRVSNRSVPSQVTLPAKASHKIDNVLAALGGGPHGDGTAFDALVIESPHRAGNQVSAFSRTYTADAGGGTYGQAVPAVPSLLGYSNHVDLSTIGAAQLADSDSILTLDRRAPGQYRHNLGIVNTSDEPITIRLRYGVLPEVDLADTERLITAPPHRLTQVSIESIFPQSILDGRPPRVSVTGSRPAALWLSIVDNKTGDASFIPFTLYDLEAQPDARLAVPAVTHTPGANGTFWRTDGYGVFLNEFASDAPPQHPTVDFYGPCGNRPPANVLRPTGGIGGIDQWHPFWLTIFADIARQVCPDSTMTTGALEVRSGSWMSFITRTYTTRNDGGTYGDVLPLYPPRGWPSRHFAGVDVSSAVRVNVGVYNGSDTPSTIEARIFTATGSTAAVSMVELAPRATSYHTLQQLFGDLPDGVYGLSITAVEGVGVWPYVSLVDNRTGDPTNLW